MRVSRRLWLLTLGLVACDEKSGSGFDLNKYDGGNWPDANRQLPVSEAGGISDARAADGGSLGPQVELKNITPISDPLQGPVLVGGTLDVVCEAKQRVGGTPVDLASVTVQLLDSAEQMLDEAPLASQGVDTFVGSISLAKVPTGPVLVRCLAQDTTQGGAFRNYGQVATFYDGGPTITFQGLADMAIVPRGSLEDDKVTEFTVNFQVEPHELAAGDSAAAVANVVLKVRDTVVTPTRDGASYSYPVDFTGLVGTMSIKDLKVSVSATNVRAPVAATATENLLLRVDSAPPTIEVMKPVDGTIVGGRVTAELTITDDLSGVADNEKLTFATIGDDSSTKVQRGLVRVGSTNKYTFDFEASEFPGLSNIPINITAVDNVGNRSSKAMSVKFDTVPPWVSLVSSRVRECRATDSSCSGAFKALGESPQDGDTILSDARFRVLVWERGIVVPGATQVWISKVQDGSVALYAQADATKPLVVDNDHDGICDSLNVDLEKTKAVRHNMTPIAVGGALPPSDPSELTMDPAAPSGFKAMTAAAQAKCNSEMTYALSQSPPDRPTAIYAKETTGNGTCAGISFNLGTAPGWTCVVGAASDNSGNLGISMPIRVCRKTSDSVDCSGAPPPGLSCTDGCTMPVESSVQYLGSRVFVY